MKTFEVVYRTEGDKVDKRALTCASWREEENFVNFYLEEGVRKDSVFLVPTSAVVSIEQLKNS